MRVLALTMEPPSTSGCLSMPVVAEREPEGWHRSSMAEESEPAERGSGEPGPTFLAITIYVQSAVGIRLGDGLGIHIAYLPMPGSRDLSRRLRVSGPG